VTGIRLMDLYDRDGNPLPEDWYDKKKYEQRFRWVTERRIGRTIVGDFTVSTVWLHGIDHGYDGRAPIIFETMVFNSRDDGLYNEELDRYSTEEQAMRGHLPVVDRLRAGRPPFTYLDSECE
jgi:hypothetical protein